jgi:hypothetical protein
MDLDPALTMEYEHSTDSRKMGKYVDTGLTIDRRIEQ